MALTGAEERGVVVGRLLAHKEHFGSLTAAEVKTAARACGVSVPTMYRWIKSGRPSGLVSRRAHRLSDEESAAYFDARGDSAAAYRSLKLAGIACAPSLSTYRRAINREFDAAARGAAKRGLPARDQNRMVLRHKPCHRNERWEGDHTMLELHVLAPGHKNPVRPWITWMIDVGSRAIMGWGISAGAPNRGAVLAAIRSGVERDGDNPFYGIPGELLWDNGLEFTANAVTEAAAMLGTVVRTTFPYSPSQKPFIERVNRTLEDELISKLPQYVSGPRRKDGSLEDPDQLILTLSDLAHRIDVWVNHYNNARPHRGLDNLTPRQKWQSDATPLREISSESARHLTLERIQRVVRRDGGIHVDSVAYISESLYGYEGETVEVGRIPYDQTRIEVFQDGRWLCTAIPTVSLTAEQTKRYRDAAKKQDDKLKSERRRLAKRQKVRIGTLTSDALDPRILPANADAKSDHAEKKDLFKFGDRIGGVR